MKEQSKDIRSDSVPPDPQITAQRKCKYENTGTCNNKANCRNYHPQKVCQQFSSFGSCSLDSICELRHPATSCFEWESYGVCRLGDKCRHRHPCVAHSGNFRQNFLYYGRLDPGYNQAQGDSQRPQSQWSQQEQSHVSRWQSGQRYHDLRGRRW